MRQRSYSEVGRLLGAVTVLLPAVTVLAVVCALPGVVWSQSILTYPRVVSSSQVETELEVENPTPTEVTVTLTAYQGDGTLARIIHRTDQKRPPCLA